MKIKELNIHKSLKEPGTKKFEMKHNSIGVTIELQESDDLEVEYQKVKQWIDSKF